jgi:hypothetical protein
MQTIKVKERKENLERIQDECGDLINVLESFRIEGGTNLPLVRQQFNVALDIVIQGANKEMNKYVRKYLNEENAKMKVPTI